MQSPKKCLEMGKLHSQKSLAFRFKTNFILKLIFFKVFFKIFLVFEKAIVFMNNILNILIVLKVL